MYDKNEDVKKLIEWTSNDSKLNGGRVEIHNPNKTYPDLIESIRSSYVVVTFIISICSNHRRQTFICYFDMFLL